MVAEMHATRQLPEQHTLDGLLLLHFAPPRPAKPKTAFAWVAQACNPKDVRPLCHYVLVAGGYMRATDGHRMHCAPTDMGDGAYHPRTGTPVAMTDADRTHYKHAMDRVYDMFYRAAGDVLHGIEPVRHVLTLADDRTLPVVQVAPRDPNKAQYFDASYYDSAVAGKESTLRLSTASSGALVVAHTWGHSHCHGGARMSLTGDYRQLVTALSEYPLLRQPHADKCPSARYVGGTTRWVCECEQPTRCPGVLAAQDEFNAKSAAMLTE